ncbi:MAG: hypothetical protein AAB536_01630 [Patescibacteria group bacterium]
MWGIHYFCRTILVVFHTTPSPNLSLSANFTIGSEASVKAKIAFIFAERPAFAAEAAASAE